MNEIKKIVAPKKPKGGPKIELNLVELERLSTLNCTMEEIALSSREHSQVFMPFLMY